MDLQGDLDRKKLVHLPKQPTRAVMLETERSSASPRTVGRKSTLQSYPCPGSHVSKSARKGLKLDSGARIRQQPTENSPAAGRGQRQQQGTARSRPGQSPAPGSSGLVPRNVSMDPNQRAVVKRAREALAFREESFQVQFYTDIIAKFRYLPYHYPKVSALRNMISLYNERKSPYQPRANDLGGNDDSEWVLSEMYDQNGESLDDHWARPAG